MDENPYLGWGLRPVELADQAVLNPYFASLVQPLSDYTFSQLFTWRNSLRILWKVIDSHLCVFANGTGDLTLLMPPIGDTASDRALRSAFDLMDDFNAAHGVPDRTRIEYASEELLNRFDRAKLSIAPMGADYVYDVQRMIDLAGGDLASKRQAKNRFMRNYTYRVEEYDAAKHHQACLQLLESWKVHQDAHHLEEPNSNAIKRSKESIATALCLESADVLGLKGMVVYVGEQGSGFGACPGAPVVQDSGASAEITTPGTSGKRGPGFKFRGAQDDQTSCACAEAHPTIRAFTFGEHLGIAQSSITIEKTDLEVKGLAQFIFSEFCRCYWADRPLVNVGDDWGLQSLAWTKQSYRPVKMLNKYVLRKQATVMSGTGVDILATPQCELLSGPAVSANEDVVIRAARKSDLDAALELEKATFSCHAISKRQMNYLRQRDSATFLVAELAGQVVGDGIALVRQRGGRRTGRIYTLVVDQAARGRKIGGKLLDALLDDLRTRGVERIYLEVQQNNTAAIALYQRADFRRIGALPDYYGPGEDGLHMVFEPQLVEKPQLTRDVA